MSRRPLTLTVCAFLLTTSTRCWADDWGGPDKALHLGLSGVLTVATYVGVSFVSERLWVRAVSAGAATLAVGAAKEAWDATGNGDPSWKDFTYDALGASLGVTVSLTVDVSGLFIDNRAVP